MKAVAYCRVSTNKEEQLDSLESQQQFFLDGEVKNGAEYEHPKYSNQAAKPLAA